MFYEIQRWGAARIGMDDDIGTDLIISDMLAGNPIWENFTDDGDPVDAGRLGHIHQHIGFLIAHNFPQFAALYTIPVFIVFDYVDANHTGVYHIVNYHIERYVLKGT